MKKSRKFLKGETNIKIYKPRELCKDCYNWCTQEDVGPYDFPQCGESYKIEAQKYLKGLSKKCKYQIIL